MNKKEIWNYLLSYFYGFLPARLQYINEGNNTCEIFGFDFKCDKNIRVRVGPVVGRVTETTAIVLLEINLRTDVTIHFLPQNNQHASRVSKKQSMPKNRPKSFFVENLVPGTTYYVVFEGINPKDAMERTGEVRTVQTGASYDMRFVALSCNNPADFHTNETNMWEKLADQVCKDEVDVVLHLGDQVYGWKEFEDAQAMLRFSNIPRCAEILSDDPKVVRKLHKAIKDRMRDIYRYTWNLPGTRTVLAKCSNLMIWSDNDIYNDFTIAKQEGEDGIEPVMIYLGHQVYREYQRQLWDVNFAEDKTTNEFHYHKWGNTGVFFHDMRGNRISTTGKQIPTNPFLNENQWEALRQALADPSLQNLFMCAEIPYVGNSPEEAKEGAKNPKTAFLQDHWAYNDTELVKILEMIFEWKSQNADEREIVLVGGDIHAGVVSYVKDAKTGLKLTQITATPITTRVSPFFPPVQGKINDRFSYVHEPLPLCRNYGYFVANGTKAHINAKLITGDVIKK